MAVLPARKVCESCGSSLDLGMLSGFCPGCLLNTVLQVEGDLVPGSQIEDYQLLSEVARGGMGIVYRARQRVPSRIVALKMILPTHLNSSGAINRFRAEAEAAASLEHEAILPIYAVGEHDGAPFYSMKFAEGGTLAARIDQYRDNPDAAAALIAKLARAVAEAHEHGILHRDLKPGNVLFDVAEKPYVSDFGLAKWLQRECDLTQTLAVLGTPFYMAPEQATDSRRVAAAADIYSLGAILYHLLTGDPPVTGDTPMEVLLRAGKERARRPRLTNRRVPRDLETICLKCLEKEPGSRYGSAAALADDLDSFCAGRTVLARPIGLTTRAWRWTRRNPLIASLTAALIALLLVLEVRDQAARAQGRKPTQNLQAFAAFTNGTEAMRRPSVSVGSLEEAQQFFEEATALDPHFAAAHARLSRVHSMLYSIFNQSELHRREAKAEADEALRLESNSGEAHLALATYLSRVQRDYAAGLKEYEIARQALPNDPYVFHGRGHAHMRLGQWDQAVADYERATVLDPTNWNMWDALGNAYSGVRKYSAAEHAKKRMLESLPPDISPAQRFNQEYSWGYSYLDLTGRFEKLDELFARGHLSEKEDPDGIGAFLRFDTRLRERNFVDAERTLAATSTTIFDLWGSARVTKNFLYGILALAQGNVEKARPFFESEIPFAQQEVRESPDAAPRHAQLGLVYAYLGRREEALAEGLRAVELMPLGRDANDGIGPLQSLAEIYARVGEADRSISTLEKLLTVPGGPSPPEMKFWFWDPLRSQPRFQELLARFSN